MRDRIKNWTRVREWVGETFVWCGVVYKIVNVTPEFWLVENVFTGRELKVV